MTFLDWARAPAETNRRTADGLRIYDLDPAAVDLWAVAGPDGVNPTEIDPLRPLPPGFRWVHEEEWVMSEKDAL